MQSTIPFCFYMWPAFYAVDEYNQNMTLSAQNANANRLVVVGSNSSVVETAGTESAGRRRIGVSAIRLDAACQRSKYVAGASVPEVRVGVPDVHVVVIEAGDSAALQLNSANTSSSSKAQIMSSLQRQCVQGPGKAAAGGGVS